MSVNRRDFVKLTAGVTGAALAPQMLVRRASAADKNRVLFVSEESNPKAIAVY